MRKLRWAQSKPLSPAQRAMLKARGTTILNISIKSIDKQAASFALFMKACAPCMHRKVSHKMFSTRFVLLCIIHGSLCSMYKPKRKFRRMHKVSFLPKLWFSCSCQDNWIRAGCDSGMLAWYGAFALDGLSTARSREGLSLLKLEAQKPATAIRNSQDTMSLGISPRLHCSSMCFAFCGVCEIVLAINKYSKSSQCTSYEYSLSSYTDHVEH